MCYDSNSDEAKLRSFKFKLAQTLENNDTTQDLKEICLQGDTIQAQKIQSDKACKLRKLECISSPKFKKTDCKLKQKKFKNLLDYFERKTKSVIDVTSPSGQDGHDSTLSRGLEFKLKQDWSTQNGLVREGSELVTKERKQTADHFENL